MVVGLGIDLVEITRMASLLERHPARAAERLFTPRERADCGGRSDEASRYAARFAAKEAFLKALGTGLRSGIGWHEMEVLNGPAGRPRLVVSGAALRRLQALGAGSIHLSLSHERSMATAVVVLEG